MRDYEELIEIWVRNFRNTLSEYKVGCGDGDTPSGVKIIFDGFGDLDDDEGYIEGGDEDMESFAVFVHENSLTQDFPEHTFTPFGLVHRPREEVCIYAWYDKIQDEITVIPFEDCSTELDHDFIKQLIHDIGVRDGYTEIDS